MRWKAVLFDMDGTVLDTLDDLPDVFLCANDFIALDALQALRDRGYDVDKPRNLAKSVTVE